MMIRLLLLVACVGVAAELRAQNLQTIAEQSEPITKFRIGASGMYAWNSHESRAHVFCCDDGCGVFGAGSGKGYFINILGEVPVLSFLDVVGSFGLAERGGDFGDARDGLSPVQDPDDPHGVVPLELKHSYTAELPELIAEIGAKLTPFKKYPAYVRTTFFYAMPMGDATSYRQTEQILSPSGRVYDETGTTLRTIGAGVIRDLQESFGVSGAIGYPFPLSSELTAAPEVSYYYPLSRTKEDFQWEISALHAGVTFRWSFIEPPIIKEIPPPPPPPAIAIVKPPQPPQPYIGLASNETVKVVETNVTETFPLLPYIFFDSGRSEILPRYHTLSAHERSRFRETDVPHNSLGAYYHLLNVVGSRLENDPSASITLSGTTDGRESGGANAKTLAKARADEVKNYLMATWGVEESRIKTTTVSTPTYPSSMREQAGIEENRRVEISSANEAMLAPIVHEQFKEFAIQPENMPFVSSVRVESPASEWKLKVTTETGQAVYETSGTGEPPSSLVWRLDNAAAARIASVVQGETKLRCALEVKDKSNNVGTSETELPVEKSIYPFELSRLSLVVFDFDKSEISRSNQQMVSTFVAKTIQDKSTVAITGTTDAMGEVDHNKELSTNRAFAVHKIIKQENPVAEVTSVQGVGPNMEPQMNSTPEGRYYCRTVTVQVQTPLQGQ